PPRRPRCDRGDTSPVRGLSGLAACADPELVVRLDAVRLFKDYRTKPFATRQGTTVTSSRTRDCCMPSEVLSGSPKLSSRPAGGVFARLDHGRRGGSPAGASPVGVSRRPATRTHARLLGGGPAVLRRAGLLLDLASATQLRPQGCARGRAA